MNTWKNYLVMSLVLIIGGLSIVLLVVHQRYKKLAITSTAKPSLQKVVQKVDKKGNDYIEIKETIYSQAQVDYITDSLKKVYNFSKIDGITTFTQKVDTISIPKYIYIDTTTKDFYVVDSNRYIRNEFKGNLKANTGSFHLTLTQDTVNLVYGFKRHLFKPNEQITNLTHSNKYYKTDSALSFRKNIPKSIIVIGPAIVYNPFQKTFNFGVSVTYNLFSFKSK